MAAILMLGEKQEGVLEAYRMLWMMEFS